MQIAETVQGRYEAQEVPFGRVYVWSPGHVLIECDCKQRASYTNLVTVCARCHSDHGASILEALGSGPLADKDAHPWRYDRGHEGAGLPY